jgi:hypothetical protein
MLVLLCAAAAGEDSPTRRWLIRFLKSSPNTPEARELKALLR